MSSKPDLHCCVFGEHNFAAAGHDVRVDGHCRVIKSKPRRNGLMAIRLPISPNPTPPRTAPSATSSVSQNRINPGDAAQHGAAGGYYFPVEDVYGLGDTPFNQSANVLDSCGLFKFHTKADIRLYCRRDDG